LSQREEGAVVVGTDELSGLYRPRTSHQGSVPRSNAREERPHTAGPVRPNGSDKMTELFAAHKIHGGPSLVGATPPHLQKPATKYSPVVPKFVETDKIILRYRGHFLEERVWDRDNHPLGNGIVENQMVRPLIINYYVEDNSIELMEPKSPNTGDYMI